MSGQNLGTPIYINFEWRTAEMTWFKNLKFKERKKAAKY